MDRVGSPTQPGGPPCRQSNASRQRSRAPQPDAPCLISAFGGQDNALFDFGLKPRKKAKISAQKMLLTVAKRNATRKARKTMGKRQKKAIKGAL